MRIVVCLRPASSSEEWLKTILMKKTIANWLSDISYISLSIPYVFRTAGKDMENVSCLSIYRLISESEIDTIAQDYCSRCSSFRGYYEVIRCEILDMK